VEIILTGYNVETELLDQFKQSTEVQSNLPLTPETISAAYARISRSSLDIKTLRKKAREDVQKARSSNQKIIFDMGHHSVAEHAVFNFDLIGISRLALEEIEKFRLVSYTEKSQRYVTLRGDFVLPADIDDPDDQKRFKDTLELQNHFYRKAFEKLKVFLFEKHPDLVEDKSRRKMVEGWAKEDARYILAMATEGQVGVTINARNLEHMFRRFALSRRAEVRDIGIKMFDLVKEIAPSLILFPEPSTFESHLKNEFKTHLLHLVDSYNAGAQVNDKTNENDKEFLAPNEPALLDWTENADDIVLAAMMAVSSGIDFEDTYPAASALSDSQKEESFLSLYQHMEFFDAPPREFEMPDVTFQAVVSSSNFAQLKRHRMASLLSSDYDINLGNVVPDNIKAVGLQEEFLRIIDETNNVFSSLRDKYGGAADYILTNSHCRKVIMKMNVRELYHFARLRSDAHAQWDIRTLSNNLLDEIKPLMPLSTLLLCGKSNYINEFEAIYHRKPKFLI
jgi:flavin-dependent thymidylate synthase